MNISHKLYLLRTYTKDSINNILLFTIKIINRHKDRCLANRLSILSKFYDPE